MHHDDPNPPHDDPNPPTAPVPDAVRHDPDVLAAVAAEALRAGVSPDAVQVVGHEYVTWPDGSLGCPQPGWAYTQALVPGRRLLLRAGVFAASYHAGLTGPFTHCPDPGPALPPEADGRAR